VSAPGTVTTYRNGFPESHHRVHAAVVRTDGALIAACGDPDRVTTLRSAAKPFQADPLVTSGGLEAMGLDDRVLAVMCASHAGQEIHVEAVNRGLAACGLDASALRNSPGPPEERLRHNCSGNHLNFLANSVHHGWTIEGYRLPDHPSQQAAVAAIAAHSGLEAEVIPTMTDGCGVVAFALPLRVIATMYARLPETLPRQFAAMTAHPELVRATGDFDTEAMRAIPGCVSKGGAEALSCVGLREQGVGIALRIDDGNSRASAPAAIAILRQVLGWDDSPDGLATLAEPVLPNTVGDLVVTLRADVELTRYTCRKACESRS
jgi:L-asparaginase